MNYEIKFGKFKAILSINEPKNGLDFLPTPCSDYSSEGICKYINGMNVIIHTSRNENNTNIVDLCINNNIQFMFFNVEDENMALVEQIYNTIEVFDGKIKMPK